MAETADNHPEQPYGFDPLIQTENIAFDPNEMIACSGCGRQNPPNRLKCLYCGHALEISVAAAPRVRPSTRKLELWERGFNILVRETLDADEGEIARLLSMETADVASILEAAAVLPLARVETETEADLLLHDLERMGLRCSIISDDALAADKPPVRLGRVDLPDGHLDLKDFNTGETTSIRAGDLTLVVPGVIAASRVDTLEKKRRRRDPKLIDEMTTSSDASLLDIYTSAEAAGFRIHMAGFDFSGLGEDKGLLAVENLRLLIVRLREHCPNAKLVSGYAALRYPLGLVWEVESRKDSKGLLRSGFGKVEFGSTASTSNLNQFTKYSRLQQHLL